MPQPVDLQTELARTHAADRIQDIAGRASLAAQQRADVAAEEKRLKIETQVNETPETETEHVDPEQKRRNPYAKRRKKRAAGADEHGASGMYSAHPEREDDDAEEQPTFDVSI
jgi:hypothetical protein